MKDVEALRALRMRLPGGIGDMLMESLERKEREGRVVWGEVIESLMEKAVGKNDEFSKILQLRNIKQRQGEPFRSYCYRVREEMEGIVGVTPTNREWRVQIATGAHELLALELEKARRSGLEDVGSG